ncbi:Lrp/AsnC family transcriptional regulator, regulator for asnA, asnC and gidA [Microlunatus sagamiharensis]|uniref:Lrp/AsnC family transcriptional regulator, regulator for asnA, asnC and gidA n=1 Tax=Microlunatus sagamiharensis TaxID=546874 RepID=A0A1H2MFC4_9ACTN|nr:Lrp/AsnC family transcriptional regulator [Microlunatus sagamiharensis]SDU91611.1 Lrp/AsnC family transcriptional regulator, regulator for asnA, asnC and gidA [Microlunatus sagamiharensis]
MSTRGGSDRPRSQAPALDDVARRLVEMLQRDGRQSYASLATAVGLSETTVRQRVQRLVDAGVIQVVAVTDPTQVGFLRQAMIGIRVDGDPGAPLAGLEALPEVEYLVSTAGSFDLLVEVVCEDDEHLLDLLARIRRLPGVSSTEAFLYLKLHRQRYDWGTR